MEFEEREEKGSASLSLRAAFLPSSAQSHRAVAIARSDTYYCMAQASIQERDRQNKINTKTLNPTELHRNATLPLRYAIAPLRFLSLSYPM
jgi:hypothetical protein